MYKAFPSSSPSPKSAGPLGGGPGSEFSQTAVGGLLAGAHPAVYLLPAAVAAGRDVPGRAGPARPRHDCQLPSDRAVVIAGDVVGC